MTPHLPDEVLLDIAQHVVSQSALAALTQASKRFYQLFTPFLYRDMWIESFNRTLTFIPDAHCSSIRSLTIADNAVVSEEEILLALPKMSNLRSLEYVSTTKAFRLYVIKPLYRISAWLIQGILIDGSDDDELQPFHGIQDITLRAPWFEEFQDWSVPRFQNLRKFHLLGMDGCLSLFNYYEIAEVILASPELRDLALMMDDYMFASDPIFWSLGLPSIINHYHTHRIARHLPLLKLSHLLLGSGFLPYHGLERIRDGIGDCLLKLTDLTALRSLKLLNCVRHELYLDQDFCTGLVLESFKAATHLRRLSVEALTPDIERLLSFPGLANSLDELTIVTPFRKPESEDIQPYLNHPGFGWKRLSLYCWPADFDEMVKAIPNLAQVTEVKIGVTAQVFETVKMSIIRALPNLEILLFLGGMIRKSQHAGFNAGKVICIAHEEDERELLHQATDIFRRNRQLVSRGHGFRPLRYVGFHTHLYTCSPIPSSQTPRRAKNVFSVEHRGAGGEYEIIFYRVTQLAMSEAITLEDIRQKLFYQESLFHVME